MFFFDTSYLYMHTICLPYFSPQHFLILWHFCRRKHTWRFPFHNSRSQWPKYQSTITALFLTKNVRVSKKVRILPNSLNATHTQFDKNVISLVSRIPLNYSFLFRPSFPGLCSALYLHRQYWLLYCWLLLC